MSSLVARAPARVDFGGGWTDVPPYSSEEGGFVCNVAVQLHAVVTVTAEVRGTSDMPHPKGDADNALSIAALRRAGLSGLQVTIESEFPVGAGLGGSSAAGVAVLGALAAWQGRPLEGAALAEASRRLEVEDLGIAGGRQDHYASALGGALALRFGDDVEVQPIPLSDRVVSELESRFCVAYTGQSRISGDTITAVMDGYRARDRRTLESLARVRALAIEMAQALASGDVDSLGRLVGEHWIWQRALHPAIPTPAIDDLIEAARQAGALGAKALGASGGGCVLAIAAPGREDEVRDAMARRARPLPIRVSRPGFRVVDRDGAGGSAR